MTAQELFEAFLTEAHLKCKTFPSNSITEIPLIGGPEEINYVTHDTVICFNYVDLYFRQGTLIMSNRCGGREDEHAEQLA